MARVYMEYQGNYNSQGKSEVFGRIYVQILIFLSPQNPCESPLGLNSGLCGQ
jgi:hypothetical protein